MAGGKLAENGMNKFAKFLIEQTPVCDKMILLELGPPNSPFEGRVLTGVEAEDWWRTREAVRIISEGLSYTPTEPPNPWEEYTITKPHLLLKTA